MTNGGSLLFELRAISMSFGLVCMFLERNLFFSLGLCDARVHLLSIVGTVCLCLCKLVDFVLGDSHGFYLGSLCGMGYVAVKVARATCLGSRPWGPEGGCVAGAFQSHWFL